MLVVGAGRRSVPVVQGRCWTARLLYLPAVPPEPGHLADKVSRNWRLRWPMSMPCSRP